MTFQSPYSIIALVAGKRPPSEDDEVENAFVAQLVEQGTENPRVVGSIPTEGTIFAGLAHLAERHLAKVEVASSNLVTRSTKRSLDAICVQTPFFFTGSTPPLSELLPESGGRRGKSGFRFCGCRFFISFFTKMAQNGMQDVPFSGIITAK